MCKKKAAIDEMKMMGWIGCAVLCCADVRGKYYYIIGYVRNTSLRNRMMGGRLI